MRVRWEASSFDQVRWLLWVIERFVAVRETIVSQKMLQQSRCKNSTPKVLTRCILSTLSTMTFCAIGPTKYHVYVSHTFSRQKVERVSARKIGKREMRDTKMWSSQCGFWGEGKCEQVPDVVMLFGTRKARGWAQRLWGAGTARKG